MEDLYDIVRKDRDISAGSLAEDVRKTVTKETKGTARDDVTMIAVKFQ